MPRVDIKQDEDNVDNHEQRERAAGEWRSLANENDNAVMSRNIRNPSEMQPRASDSMHVTPVWQRPQQPVSWLADAASSLPAVVSSVVSLVAATGVEWSLPPRQSSESIWKQYSCRKCSCSNWIRRLHPRLTTTAFCFCAFVTELFVNWSNLCLFYGKLRIKNELDCHGQWECLWTTGRQLPN